MNTALLTTKKNHFIMQANYYLTVLLNHFEIKLATDLLSNSFKNPNSLTKV